MDRFKLILDFQTGVTVGDRNAFLDKFTGDLVEGELVREEIRSTDDQVVIVYSFAHARTPDEMHETCRAIFRYLRKYGRILKGICISDRSWWKPTFKPGQPDPIDPLNPADP